MQTTPLRNRPAAVTAILGALLLFVGSWLHPMDADPNVAQAAFAEYAHSTHWVGVHLLQLLGAMVIVASLTLICHQLRRDGRDNPTTTLTLVAGASTLAVSTALQAVDGIALKACIDAWVNATGPDKAALFHTAFGVRQVEIGLASMAALLFGITATLFGVALLGDGRLPARYGWLAIAGGIPTAVAGVVMAYTGFSSLSMLINMPASMLLLAWLVGLGVKLW